MDVLAERRIPGDPDAPNSDRQIAAGLFLKNNKKQQLFFPSFSLNSASLTCVEHPVLVWLSPGVSERLFTGEALGRIFFHETANEILGWQRERKKKTHSQVTWWTIVRHFFFS